MADARKERDWLDVVDIVVKAVATVALPLALFFAGRIVAEQQSRDQDLRRREDRVTDLLEYLASTEQKKRLLGVSVLRGVTGDGKLPPELSSALIEIAMTDESDEVKKAALVVVDAQPPAATPIPGALPQNGSELVRPSSAAGARRLPARVYIQIASENQRTAAKNLETQLETEDLVIPGIQRVPNARLQRTELRYFWPDDQSEAEQIAGKLASIGVQATVLSPPAFARSGRPRHFELWLQEAAP